MDKAEHSRHGGTPDSRPTPTIQASPANPLNAKSTGEFEDLAEHSMINRFVADGMDRTLNAALARVTGGIAPGVVTQAFTDWLFHLAMAPGKRARLLEKAGRKAARLATFAARSSADTSTLPCIAPLPQDRRFRDEAWQRWPHNTLYQSFLLTQQWWHNATTDVRGVSKSNENIVNFVRTTSWRGTPT